jgi:death on curing protein
VIKYLNGDEIVVLHQLLLDEFGGMHGITEQGFGRLEIAVGTPQQTMFGDDLYPTLHDKGAAFFRALVRGHPFSDGNKRVAVLALCEFLGRNGAELHATNDEVYDLAMAAANDLSREAIVAWLREHVS